MANAGKGSGGTRAGLNSKNGAGGEGKGGRSLTGGGENGGSVGGDARSAAVEASYALAGKNGGTEGGLKRSNGGGGGGDGKTGVNVGESARSAAFEASHALAVDMRFGAVDQLVCSRAVSFVGNLWSSFSHHICYLRQLRAEAEGRPRAEACDGADVYGRSIDPKMSFI
jgi:hypothetical protein